MLNNDQIFRTLREVFSATHHDFNLEDIHHIETNKSSYDGSQVGEFERDLIEGGNSYGVNEAYFQDILGIPDATQELN